MRFPSCVGRPAGLLVLALLLTACEDLSGVGPGILDPSESDPGARAVPAELGSARLPVFPGVNTDLAGPGPFRMLAGRVEDPLVGTVEASGYLAFRQPLGLPSDFFFTPIEDVVLRLRPDYRYGEVAGIASYDVYEVAEGWNAGILPSDSTLAVLPQRVTSFSVAPGDTLVEVRFPAAWVASRDSIFVSNDFNQIFHGFEFRPRPESRAVLGFDGERAELLLLAPRPESADTVVFRASQAFSNVRLPSGAPAVVDGLVPLQNTTSRGLRLRFDLTELSPPPAVTGAFVRLDADTTRLATPGFVRPLARTLALYGLGQNGEATLLSIAALDPRSQTYTFSSPAPGAPARLGTLFQQALLGRSRFTAFAVGFPGGALPTLDVAPIVATAEAGPRAVLLVVPAD